jgi:phosphoribosylaminoimidazolecarboxamide formyltransferase/IMP cyclohydrolase
MASKQIQSALISVFDKSNLEPLISQLHQLGITIYSTGGTQKYIQEKGVPVTAVEDLTEYPSIFGGRVKTLHPKVFGGILHRRDNESDNKEKEAYQIPAIDLVIVDLYPFEATVAAGGSHAEIIEKIDIGGIALIRAAAKNYKDCLIVPSKTHYDELLQMLEDQKGSTTEEQRARFAAYAFNVSSHYDTAIFNYMNREAGMEVLKVSEDRAHTLRYGENPHQKGVFYGNLDELFEQLHGKQISYNNLLDIDAAVNLMSEFSETTFAILKHNNACGLASRERLTDAWKDALAGDPVSAFGGILITNKEVDKETAEEMDKLFFEVSIAPGYSADALEVLKRKKNRIILLQKTQLTTKQQHRSLLNGTLEQDKDLKQHTAQELEAVTKVTPTSEQVEDLLFANKIVKHTKSNAIVLAKNKQLCASGVGQTSRIDALKQAIDKARHFELDLQHAVMASDAFFPFADSVEIADKAGITAVIQPGGSVRDKDSIAYCDEHNMAMVFTGNRHFKH